MRGPSRSTVSRGAWLAVVALAVAAPCGAQQARRTYAILGSVVDSLAQPVPGAEVSIAPLHVSAFTDPAGRFRLANVPAGAFVLQFRKVGFGPVDVAVLMPRDTSVAATTMVQGAILLRTIVTRTVGPFDKPIRLAYTSKYDEFYERRKFSAGSARFYTHEDIERMGVQDFMDILRRIPHLQMWDEAGNTMIRFPHCGMNGIMIQLDGRQIWPTGANVQRDVGLNNPSPASVSNQPAFDSLNGPDPLDLLRPLHDNNVEAIEVYPSSSSLPVDAVGNACGAIFVWSR